MSDDDLLVPTPSGLDWADEPAAAQSSRCSVQLTKLGDRKISVIKVVREYFGLGLADAKRLVESAPVTVAEGVSRELATDVIHALSDVGATASIVGAGPLQSGGFASVILHDHGPRKIAIIKLVREVTGLGLKDAKNLVETPNATVVEGVSRERAERLLEQITAQHGLAVIEGADGPGMTQSRLEPNVTLVLTFTGPKKINIIRIIREASGMGLKECKDMSENVPAVVSTSLSRVRAEAALASIREAGGDGRLEG